MKNPLSCLAFALSLVLFACGGAIEPASDGAPAPSSDAAIDAHEPMDARADAAADASKDAAAIDAGPACPGMGQPCSPLSAPVCKDNNHRYECTCFAAGCAWMIALVPTCPAPYCM